LHSAGRQWQTPKTAADANIIRVTDSVIQVADKSSGGKKQRFLRGQEAWEDRATGPVLPGGGGETVAGAVGDRFGTRAGGGGGMSFSGNSALKTALLSEYAAASDEKPIFLLSKGAQNSDRASFGGKTVGRNRL